MKTLHYVSHSHWDREWYMPFQAHRMKLVEMMDSLLDTLDKDDSYKCFYMDGHVLLLDDYLDVKPEMKDKVKKYIAEGRIKFGPWFILQDEYLISAESNVRNMLYGLKQARRYGVPSRIGYLPDSFGNISQMPQIFRGFGIDNAVFGRGINPVGFDNEVKDSENEGYKSEVMWKAPDGSEVMGILMANWYCNGNEVPEKLEDAVDFVLSKKADAEKYATTSHLLFMNGCDHQPIQTNVGQIIDKVQDEIEDTILHSCLDDYIEAVKGEAKDLQVVEGELNSQLTDGWWTLANTASSRVYLKQMNHKAETLLERYVEPMETLAWLKGKPYNEAFVWQAYRFLLQNHPHDSICGCSLDEVHEEMVVRFKNSMQNSEGLIHESLDYMFNVDKKDLSNPLVYVYNSLNWKRSQVVEVVLDLPKEESLSAVLAVDEEGREYPVDLEDQGVVFTYTLPKDSFRQVEYVHRYTAKFLATDLPCYGFGKYSFKEVEKAEKEVIDTLSYDNSFFSLDFNKDGSFNMHHKATGKNYNKLNAFEYGSDVGNEYVYRASAEDIIKTTLGNEAKVEKIKDTEVETVFKVSQLIEAPAYWTKIDEETSQPAEELATIELDTLITVSPTSPRVDIKTDIMNSCKDYRLRAMFPTDIEADYHYAESQFDVIKRKNMPWKGWKNPSNCQKHLKFVDVSDEKRGFMVINKGLPEYEVLRDGQNTVGLTILRGTSELGDWGIFPTPEAQCIGKNHAEYAIIAHEGNYVNAYREAYNFNTGTKTLQSSKELTDTQLFDMESKTVVVSSVKKAEDRESMIIRVFNIHEDADDIQLKFPREVKEAYAVNLEEKREGAVEIQENTLTDTVGKRQIKTYEIVF